VHKIIGPGIESRWRRDFPQPSRRGPFNLLYIVPRFSFQGVKRPGRNVDHPLPSDNVKERVKLYIYSPSGLTWPVVGRPYRYLSSIVMISFKLFRCCEIVREIESELLVPGFERGMLRRHVAVKELQAVGSVCSPHTRARFRRNRYIP
jgi:hypothetical protein